MAGYGYGYFQGGVPIGSNVNPNVDGAPTLLTATSFDDDRIDLAWTIGSTNHEGHRIYISTDNVSFIEKGTVTGATATYQAIELAQDTRYYFKVVAYRGSNESAATNTADDYTYAPISMVSTGNGTGISTLELTTEINQAVKITGAGRFYTNAAGTEGESTTWVLTSGTKRTTYLKLSTGSCKVLIKNGVTMINSWTSSTNGASINMVVADFKTGLGHISITGSNTISGNLADFKTGLGIIYISGSNTISGNLADFKTGLSYIIISGSNTISGNLADFKTGLSYISISGSNTISGNLADFKTGLSHIIISGSNTISGNLADFKTGLSYISISGSNTISDYTPKTWVTKPATFTIEGLASLNATEVDSLLIDLDRDLVWGDGNSITIKGNCAARTSASDAAVLNMQSEGATISTN